MTTEQAERTIVTVYIYPINDEDEPLSQWQWDAEIIIREKPFPKSIFGSNPLCFDSLQEAFEWAYEWLNTNGYDASNLEFEMNDKAHKGIRKK